MSRIERVGVYSVGVNVFLVALKLGLAAFSGSLALAADATHSLVDAVASLVVLGGLVISRRGSRSFPYGLYKIENVASVLVALLIFLAGYEIAREALLAPPRDVANAPLALAGVALSILTVFAFSRYELRLGKAANSPSLVADSEHFRVDMLASGIVFVSILGNSLGIPLDRLGSAVVVIFVLRAGWGILVDGMRVLLDASLDQETLTQVRNQLAGEPGVAEIRSLVGRNSGRYKFIELEIAVRTPDLEEAHRLSERLEAGIKANVPYVDRVIIHCEPRRKDLSRWAVPLESPEGTVSPHLGKAPYVAIVEVRPSSGEVLGYEVVGNPYLDEDRQKGIKLADFVARRGVDEIALRESLDGRGPAYVFSAAGVAVRQTQATTLGEVLAELRAVPTNRAARSASPGAISGDRPSPPSV